MSKAIEDVLAERRRQVEVEDFTDSHDDTATRGQLAAAAACYALTGTPNRSGIPLINHIWPWEQEWWKPTFIRRNLVKAAALLIAEIERIDRADANVSKGISE